MPHYSYIVQDYYYYKKELVTLIDVVDIDRQMRLREEAIIHKKNDVYLSTTFKEDLLKLLNEKLY